MNQVFRDPERWEELVADEALVGLSDDDRHVLATFEAEDRLARESELFGRAAGEIAAAAFEQTNGDTELGLMPAHLKTRLLTLVNERSQRGAPQPAPAPEPRVLEPPKQIGPRRGGRVALWALVAAAVVLALIGWTREPRKQFATQETPDSGVPKPASERERLLALAGTARIDFAPTKDPAAQQAKGDVVWHSGLQRGYMRIAGLAPNDPKLMQYQLWVFDAERGETYPVDGGVFDIEAPAEVIVPINAKLAIGKAKLFAVTVEKPGGVVVSKRERIVLTAALAASEKR